MNIVTLEVLLHHAYKPEPYPRDTPAVRDAHMLLVREGLIVPENGGDVVHNNCLFIYRTTERGRVYINALMSVQLPVQAWTMPKPTKD